MSVKLGMDENVRLLREAILRYNLRCHVDPGNGRFRFQEREKQTVFYFPKKNRYRLAGQPDDVHANARDFIEWYLNIHLGLDFIGAVTFSGDESSEDRVAAAVLDFYNQPHEAANEYARRMIVDVIGLPEISERSAGLTMDPENDGE